MYVEKILRRLGKNHCRKSPVICLKPHTCVHTLSPHVVLALDLFMTLRVKKIF